MADQNLEDVQWLASILYEFLLTGPGSRGSLTEVEMERFLTIRRRLATYG